MGSDAIERRGAYGRARNGAKPSPSEVRRPGPPGPSRALAARSSARGSMSSGACGDAGVVPPRESPVLQEQVVFPRGLAAEMLVPPVVLDTQTQAALAWAMLPALSAPPKRRNGVTPACAEHNQRQPSLWLLPKPAAARLTLHLRQRGSAPPEPRLPRASGHPQGISVSSPTARAGHCDSSREGGRRLTRLPRQGRGEGRSWAARSRWSLPAPLPRAASVRRKGAEHQCPGPPSSTPSLIPRR